MANLAKCSVLILILLCGVPVLAAQTETVSVIQAGDSPKISHCFLQDDGLKRNSEDEEVEKHFLRDKARYFR